MPIISVIGGTEMQLKILILRRAEAKLIGRTTKGSWCQEGMAQHSTQSGATSAIFWGTTQNNALKTKVPMLLRWVLFNTKQPSH